MYYRFFVLIFSFFIVVLVFYSSRESSIIVENSSFLPEKININNATKEEIERLPLIGEKKANRILESRRKFKVTPQILEKIVGKKTFSKISSKISY